MQIGLCPRRNRNASSLWLPLHLPADFLLYTAPGWMGILQLAAFCGHLAPANAVVSFKAKGYAGLTFLLPLLDFLKTWLPYIIAINQEFSRSSNCKPKGGKMRSKWFNLDWDGRHQEKEYVNQIYQMLFLCLWNWIQRTYKSVNKLIN